tara:strand:+ start:636 stop:1043 length:408 start_codon:yes stop_codon:yes gene_type:complete
MAEQYIFNQDAQEVFYEKLDKLHESYVYHLIMSGVAPKGSDLESIKMTKNLQVNEIYCKTIVGGFVNTSPNVIVKLEEDKQTRLECIITKLNDKKHINYMYMIQNVMDWPKVDSFSCQIWYLGETTIGQIKEIFN